MLQEIITYLIIAGAVILTLARAFKRFKKKQAQLKQGANKNAQDHSDCSSCSAECMIRNLPKRNTQVGIKICNENQENSESL